jgi:Holliday junction resolvase RusA-like endonuclease
MIRQFFVPGAPQGKGRARVAMIAGHARAYTPEKTASYESLIKAQYHLMYPGELPILGEVNMEIRAWFEIPKSTSGKKAAAMLRQDINPTKKPDSDNIAKCVCDALNGIAYRDDTQIINLHISKRYAERAGVDVWISDTHKEG